jgi:hypothetical protein
MSTILLIFLGFFMIHFNESVVVNSPNIINNVTKVSLKITKLLLDAFFKELCI